MKTVREILQEKGFVIEMIDENRTVQEALQRLAQANIGALVVTDAQGAMLGMISERDYVRKVIVKGEPSLNKQVKEFMSDQIYSVHPDQSVDECMALVTEKRCRHLPVLDDGKLVGIVSIGDLVKASIAEKEFLINQLTRYIQSYR
ncbi:MAG: CBS domain-containing protein [Deltaproteobacteria bacterium]|nr:CBS domain-containing protein [Deltaproteobacteria bacterium]